MMSVLQKAKSAVAAVLVREPDVKPIRPLDFDKATAVAVDASKAVAAKRAKIRECENEVAAADAAVQKARKLLAACKEVDPRIDRVKMQLAFLRARPERIEALFAAADKAIESGAAGEAESLRQRIVEEMYTRPQFAVLSEAGPELSALSRNHSKAAGLRSDWTQRLEKEKAGLASVRSAVAADVLRESANSLAARERKIRDGNPDDKHNQLAQLEADQQELDSRYAIFRAVTGQTISPRATGY